LPSTWISQRSSSTLIPNSTGSAVPDSIARRALESGTALPVELGISVEDERWLIHVDRKESRVEPEKLSRRHLTLSPSGLVRLLLGHTGIDAAAEEEGFVASTSTAIDAARILFPPQPLWRSPLDSATA
jgi:hypothetical protein